MKVEIDLSDLGFVYDEDGDPVGKATLQDAVIQEAARQVVADIDREARQEIGRVTREVVSAQVNALVVEHVQQVMSQPIQRTTGWGEKQGEPVSILELIRVELEKFLTLKPGRRDSYNSNPQCLADVISDATRDAMNRELREEVAKAKKNVHNAVTEAALSAAVAALAGTR